MAKFTFGKTVDIHWNGYEIVGPALTEFSIPDQLYEEFEGDFRDVEPSLTWTDTNEFATLSASVSVTTLTGTIPISVTSTTSGKIVSISSSTNPAGYYLRADGTGATTWAALPADATGITSVIGTSPISAAVVGSTATISLSASYQTAGSYATLTDAQTLTNKTLTLPLINNTNGDYTTTVTTAATTYPLTVSSTRVQYFTGSTSGLVISLPATSTIAVGHSYEFHNNSTASIVVSTFTAQTLATIVTGLSYRITCISVANNATTSWDAEVIGSGTATGTGASVFGTSPTISSPSISGPTITGTATMTSAAITGITYIRTAGWSSIATAAGTSSISTTGNGYLKFTGTTTQFANLSASGTAGLEYRILNTSTGAVTLRSSDLSTVAVLQQNQVVRVILNTTSGTTAASWDVEWGGAPTSTGTGSTVYSASPTLASPTLTGDVTINAQGDLRLADADSSNYVALQAPATVNSNVTFTLPSADGTSGQALTTNGTGTLSFSTPIASVNSTTLTGSGTWTIPSGVSYLKAALLVRGGTGGASGAGILTTAGVTGAAGGASGAGGDGVYYANIYVGDVTSMSYSVGAGGAGGTGTTVTKTTGTSPGTLTSTLTAATSGTASTLGAYLSSTNSQNVGYEQLYIFRGGASKTGGSDGTNSGQGGSNQAGDIEIENLNASVVSDREDLRSIGYFVATTYGAGNAGSTGIATASLTAKATTGSGGAAGDAGYYAVQSGGGGGSGATALQAAGGGAGYRGGSGGGGGANYYSTVSDGTQTVTVTGGAGGAGLAGTGCGGGGGGGALARNSNTSGYTSLEASVTGGNGGAGGSGTIIIWW